jgi:hypothetical protein
MQSSISGSNKMKRDYIATLILTVLSIALIYAFATSDVVCRKIGTKDVFKRVEVREVE